MICKKRILSKSFSSLNDLKYLVLLYLDYRQILWVDLLKEEMMKFCSLSINRFVKWSETFKFIKLVINYRNTHISDFFIELIAKLLTAIQTFPDNLVVKIYKETENASRRNFLARQFHWRRSTELDLAIDQDVKLLTPITIVEERFTLSGLKKLHPAVEIVESFLWVLLSHLLEETKIREVHIQGCNLKSIPVLRICL